MTRLLSSRRTRWALPAVVAAAMAAAALTTTGGAGATERPQLPAKSAAQLLAAVEAAHPQSLSGTIVETAHLGLPTLPTNDVAGSGLSPETLLTGSHTMRVWYDGPTRQRIALLAPLSERDVIHNGTDLWTYMSTTNEVTHATVARTLPTIGPETIGLTPQKAAQLALAAITPSTKVTVDLTARVAGRAAYQIDLTPSDPRSLVSVVRIAIDSATSVPLRVQVFGSGTTPALEIGFTDISFAPPSLAVFRFVPPAGATVDDHDTSTPPAARTTPGSTTGKTATPPPSTAPTTTAPSGGNATTDAGAPKQLGTGWTTVMEYPAAFSLDGWHGDMIDKLSIAVPSGRLIKTALFSVLVTHSGDVYLGSVSGADLQQVAATGHGL